MTIKARIFKSSKRQFDCQLLETKEIVQATAMAALLKEDHLVVGDWVTLNPGATSTDSWSITSVDKRQNAIFRNLPREQKKKVIASNVDLILIVASVGKPSFKRGLIDRYLTRSSSWEIPAFVVFNKMDQYDPEEFSIVDEADRLKWLDAQCFEVCAEDPTYNPKYLAQGIDELAQKLKGKTAILLGHSGVGKSKLITTLSQGKVQLLSAELGKVGKGAHTTTWAELIDAELFHLIDSPGVRSMSVTDLTRDELLYSFPDINEFAAKCRFSSSCTHDENAKGCYFQSLDKTKREDQLILSRLDSFKRMLEEVSNIPDWLKKS